MKLDKQILQFVPNSCDYYEFIRELRMDPDIISGFVSQVRITKEQQLIYMDEHEKDYYVCLHGGRPIGFIGVVAGDLRLAVDRAYQRKGVASFMLAELFKLVPDFQVRVKKKNHASIKFFEKFGFANTGNTDQDGCFLMEKRNASL
jgi:GNAT superfamily N-acetyltransferase